MKKLLAILISAIMLLTVFVSCGNTPTDTAVGSDSDGSTNDDIIEKTLTLFTKGKGTDYKIIYADDSKSDVITAANGLAYNIEKKYGIAYLEITREFSNWGLDGEIDTEILIGDTLRNETAETKKLLKGADNEYAIKLFDNGKLAIVGSNSIALRTAVYYFLNEFITSDEKEVLELDKGYFYYCDMGEISSAKWSIPAPEYEGGIRAKSTYNTGANISLSNQSSGKMHLISETNAEEFNAYLAKLEADGYVEEARTENNGNIYVQFVKGTKVLYTYFLEALGEVRVIDDYASLPESQFEYTCEDGEAVYYQYGMMHDPTGAGGYDPSKGKLYENNGAFDIIKLADNKLILFDGGSDLQVTDDTTKGLVDFLHEITGTAEDEKIVIAAWFLSHYHGDHYKFIERLADDYADQFVFERVMHNIPAGVAGGDLATLSSNIIKNNPNVKFMKLHTGQNIKLGNISFDILMTHEDALNLETGKSFIINDNNTSTVMKININGRSIMYLGDWGGGNAKDTEEYAEMERRLMDVYKKENGSNPTIKSDIVQIAHHGINDYMPALYAAIEADYAFFSQADASYNELTHICYRNIIDQLRRAGIQDENIYFAGRKTNWLTIGVDGTVTHGAKPFEGADAGYWDLLKDITPWNGDQTT